MTLPHLEDLQLLAAVAEQGSFTAAARRTGTSQSRVSRAVGRLEERLGVTLVRRTSRQVAITPEGQRYAELARSMLRDLEATEMALSAGDALEGRLSVSMPPSLGRRLLLPIITDFSKAHPSLRLHLSLDAERVDLIAHETDVAIRFGPLADTWQRARLLLRGAYHVYGAPDLVESLAPGTLSAQLESAPCLVLDATHLRHRWPTQKDNELHWTEVRPAVTTDDVDAMIMMMVEGIGLGMVPDFLVQEEVAGGELVALTHPEEAVEAKVFALHDAAEPPTRARRLVEHLVEQLVTEPSIER